MHCARDIKKYVSIILLLGYSVMTYQLYNIPTTVPQAKIPTYEPYNRLSELQLKKEIFKEGVDDCMLFLNASAKIVEELQTVGAWKNWDKARKKCDYHKKALKEVELEYEKEKNKN